MGKVTNTPLPTELPMRFLARLDPELRQLYSQLPSAVAARISVLATKSMPLGIHPNRVFKFALLYATAERRAQGDRVSKEHTRRARLELAGGIHGLKTGYRDDAEAKRRYRRGRRARQQIKASLEAVLGRWQAFKQVVQQHRSELPVHIQSRFSDVILGEVGKRFQYMGIAVVLGSQKSRSNCLCPLFNSLSCRNLSELCRLAQ